MKVYICPHCGFGWNTKFEAEQCCVCLICGQLSPEQNPCDECRADRQCDYCFDIHENENPYEGMHYGCCSEGLEEDTLCHICWLEQQSPLVQLGDCAE